MLHHRKIQQQKIDAIKLTLRCGLDSMFPAFPRHVFLFFFFFFFLTVNVDFSHKQCTHTLFTGPTNITTTFSLKMSPTILFTHLKIILNRVDVNDRI